MRIKTELSERPQEFTVNREGNRAVIIFYTDVQEVQREEGSSWEAVSWTMETPWQDDIAARIGANLASWLAKAQADAYREAAAEVRAKRDDLLAATDYEKCIDRLGLTVPTGTTFASWKPFLETLGEAVSDAVSTYRQALRDIPEQPGFPFEIEWPEEP